MEIGGFFPYEILDEKENGYFNKLSSNIKDFKHLMSGRCAIYYALKDIELFDNKKIAYVPSYTCETVISAFVKADYKIEYYDFDKNLRPIFHEEVVDNISVLLISGYYGFPTYNKKQIDKFKNKSITIIEDITHTAFSYEEIYKNSDYIVGSLRKWMGVISGGIAIKTNGIFNIELEPFNNEHLNIRKKALKTRSEYEITGDDSLKEEAYDNFWKAEFMLRDIFDMQKGDEESLNTIKYYALNNSINKRVENYNYLLENLPNNSDFKPVFNNLPENICPMFFPFFSDNRENILKYLEDNNITPKIYWPVPPFVDIAKYPGAKYIYEHIFSISCDHRFSTKDMEYIIDILKKY